MDNTICAIGRKGLCFTKEESKCMINSWNSIMEEKVSDLNNLFDIVPAYILLYKKDYLKNLFKLCPDLYDTIKYFSIKPVMKVDFTYWLSNLDIDSVMTQYDKMIPDFEFIGTFTRDTIPIDSVKNNRNLSYGIVINTCTIYQRKNEQKHWICAFKEKGKNYFEFFNSSGKSIPKDIFKDLVLLFNLQDVEKGKKCLQNKIRYQKQNYHCGVFVLFFLIHRALGYEKEILHNINDEKMENFKSNIFVYKN